MKGKAKTKMVTCRGGEFEFCDRNGLGLNDTHPAYPPWYVIKIQGMFWSEPWYLWVGYGGPPKVFLTRKRAEEEAKAFRKQYGGRPVDSCGRLKVTIVKIDPTKV